MTQYTAPEVMCRESPSKLSDYYSLGILMYELIKGKTIKEEFNITNKEDLINVVTQKQLLIKKSDLPLTWSRESADFINKLIMRDPLFRIGANGVDELKKHTWLKNAPFQKIENLIYQSNYIPKTNQLKNWFSSIFKSKPKQKALRGLFHESPYQYTNYDPFATYYFSSLK